ncbi:MAG: GNAT family N-acetyltransferase [Firmicutes bacterium]|nr:GNAT family N-acetyltransferase [Bacillota bacterium]
MDMVIKRAVPGDIDRLGQLSDRVFRPTLVPGTGMPLEFGPMFSSTNAANLYFAADVDEPVCLVGMMPGIVQVGSARISVASMGSVCTLANYRKRQLASAAIEQILQDFSMSTSVLLVSGDLSIYRRIGCVTFGNYLSMSVPRGRGQSSDGIVIDTTLPERVADEATRVYQAERLRFSRTPAQMASLLATLRAPHFRATATPPQMFVARLRQEVVAYAIALPSQDGVAHLLEWAGARSALPALLEAAMRHFDCAQAQLYVEPEDFSARAILHDRETVSTPCENQGTIRILNPDLLIKESQPWVEERYGARVRLLEVRQDEWKVSWEGGDNERAGASPLRIDADGKILKGFGDLSRFFFGRDGLDLPLPRTDDLNYI